MRKQILVLALLVVAGFTSGCKNVENILGIGSTVELTLNNSSPYIVEVIHDERVVNPQLSEVGTNANPTVTLRRNDFRAEVIYLTVRRKEPLPPGCAGGEDKITVRFPREGVKVQRANVRLSAVRCTESAAPTESESGIEITIINSDSVAVDVVLGEELLAGNTVNILPNEARIVRLKQEGFAASAIYPIARRHKMPDNCSGARSEKTFRFPRSGWSAVKWNVRLSRLRCN